MRLRGIHVSAIESINSRLVVSTRHVKAAAKKQIKGNTSKKRRKRFEETVTREESTSLFTQFRIRHVLGGCEEEEEKQSHVNWHVRN